MKTIFSILIFSCVALLSFSQGKIIFDTIPKPQLNKSPLPQFELPLMMENSFLPGKLSLTDPGMFNQPLLPDYNKILNLWKTTTSFTSVRVTDLNLNFGYSPFFSSEKVFNQAAYRISDKFLFGGNSFGAQSVFDRPMINPAIRDMSTKGASMFMQYKVSRNFRIETRVSVSGHQSDW